MAGGIKAVIATQFDATGVNKAIKEFDKLSGSIKGIAGSLGIGLGLSAITDVLKESAQAAIGDVKSQALLANQLRNTVGASDAQVAAVEASIKAMQMQAAVADDDIRPAFASLVRATGDVTQATSLTSLALDVAAGTGKDLGAVSLALGKAVNGSTTSLLKLVPSIKGASDPMGELSKQFAGAAAEAANNDPIQRLTVVMGELQEQLGTYLLPALEEFAGFLADSSTQDSITWMIDEFGTWTKQMGLAADGVFYLGDQITNFFETISGNFGQTPFTEWLSGLVDRLNNALNPLQRLVNLLQQFGLLSAKKNATGGSVLDSYKYNTGQYGKKADTTKTKPKGDPNADAKKLAAAAKARQTAIAKALADSLSEAKKQLSLANDLLKAEYEKSVAIFDEQTAAIDAFKTQLGDVRGATQPLAREGDAIGRFAQSVIDSFNAIDKSVLDNQKIFEGDGQSLRDYVATEKGLLLNLAKQRDALAEKYSLAQAVKTDIEGAIRSFGNITNLLDKQSTQVTETMTSVVDGIQLTRSKLVEQTTTGNIVSNFQAILDKTKAFATSLKKLRALGLDQNLYKQIVDAGVDAGGQTAEAILAGGSDTVASLNTIFKDLNSVGADIGEQTAQVMYGAGVDLTNGLLEGIKSKDQELMDQAKSMATLFADTFNSMVSKLIIQPTAPASNSLAMQYPGFSDYINGALKGYSGEALTNQIDMLTGANVSAPGSFMNSLGYMKSNGVTVNINANTITDQASLPALVTNALVTASKQGLTGSLSRVLAI
jgi:hypothetical protein